MVYFRQLHDQYLWITLQETDGNVLFRIVANIYQRLFVIGSTIIQAAFDPEAFKKFFIQIV